MAASVRGRRTRSDAAHPSVAAVITHDNVDGLRTIVPALLAQARQAGVEVCVVAGAPSPQTEAWLADGRDALAVIRLESDRGPAGSRNAVFDYMPGAEVYFLFDDDVILRGGELDALWSLLRRDDRIGLASGNPVTETGEALARDFLRRPWESRFPKVWDRWWGPVIPSADSLVDADVVSGGHIAVRGRAVAVIGGFEEAFWPGCHEDLDFCARLRHAGFRVVVDRSLDVPQKVSATMGKVFGARRSVLCQATSVLFAAMDYPTPFAAARVMEAVIRCISPDKTVRRGAVEGLLRCSEQVRGILRARRARRRLRARRNQL